MSHIPLLVLSVAFSFQGPVTESGKVETVTLYRGQALVTRSIPLPPRSGALEIVVPDMPQAVVAGSLYAEGADGTEVRAVRYRTRAVGEAPRAEVRALQLQIEEAKAALATNDANRIVVSAKIGYIRSSRGFRGLDRTS